MDTFILSRAIGRTALNATLFEVSAAPKPGLVHPLSNGAHTDMDYFLFLSSATAIAPYFIEFAQIGADFDGELHDLLSYLRIVGINAENAMFSATKGVNTHKGLIFSLGLMCAAAGRLIASGRAFDPIVCASLAAKIVEGITIRELAILKNIENTTASSEINREKKVSDKNKGKSNNKKITVEQTARQLSAGEQLYIKYGITGVRGEAENGFPSVVHYGLPRLHADLLAGMSWNDAMINALLVLCQHVDDTTVLNRAGPAGLYYVRAQFAEALKIGGMASEQGRAFIRKLDDEFCRQGLSPGGCADLLAVAVFLELLSQEWQKSK